MSDAVDAANEFVSIVQLLRDNGHYAVNVEVGSVKTHCPFDDVHMDGGVEAAFRIYSTNTAFCYAGCGFFTPVILAMQLYDLPEEEAATRLLHDYGVVAGLSWRERSEALLRTQHPGLSLDHLVAALRVRLSSHACYRGYEYDPEIVDAVDRCLRVTPAVTDSTCRQWLDASEAFVLTVVRNRA